MNLAQAFYNGFVKAALASTMAPLGAPNTPQQMQQPMAQQQQQQQMPQMPQQQQPAGAMAQFMQLMQQYSRGPQAAPPPVTSSYIP